MEDDMQGFNFCAPADPKNPKDKSDPPPSGWDTMDTSDFRRALWGMSDLYERCRNWQDRELARYGMKCIYEFRNWKVVPLEENAAS